MAEPLGEHYTDAIKAVEGFLKAMRYHVEIGKPHRIQQDARSVIYRMLDLIEYATADVIAALTVTSSAAVTWLTIRRHTRPAMLPARSALEAAIHLLGTTGSRAPSAPRTTRTSS